MHTSVLVNQFKQIRVKRTKDQRINSFIEILPSFKRVTEDYNELRSDKTRPDFSLC